MDFSAAQCRAARALLDMSQTVLAEEAGVGVSSVADIEGERRDVSHVIREAVRKALERRGVVFLDPDEHGGPGLRLALPKRRRRARAG